MTLEKDDPRVTHSDKTHRATQEDAYAKAWFAYFRNAFPQPVRKASPDVDFYNVPLHQLLSLLELNNELKIWLDTQKEETFLRAICFTKKLLKNDLCNKRKTTARVMGDCVLFAHSIYDETQVITAAHEVSKSNVGMVAVSRECKGFIITIFTEPVIAQWPSF